MYRVPCIFIATNVIIYIYIKTTHRHKWEIEIIEFLEVTLSSIANLRPPDCEQTQRPSQTVFGNPQCSVQMAQQPFEQCSSKGLCRCKCVYTLAYIHSCAIINFIFLSHREKWRNAIYYTWRLLKGTRGGRWNEGKCTRRCCVRRWDICSLNAPSNSHHHNV
jgi:hypothetical protein